MPHHSRFVLHFPHVKVDAFRWWLSCTIDLYTAGIVISNLICKFLVFFDPKRYSWGAFVKLRKAATSFVMSVCPSAWNNSASAGRIFMKFYIWVIWCFSDRATWYRLFSSYQLEKSLYFSIFRKSVDKIQDSLKSDKNNGYFTWIPIYTFDRISHSS